MGKIPLIDLSAVTGGDVTSQRARELRSIPTEKIKSELLRRKCVDFSRTALHMRMAFLYLVLALLITYQINRLLAGHNLLECLL